MTDLMTDLDELLPLLDAFTLAFAVHVTAESKVVAAAARAAPAAARVLGLQDHVLVALRLLDITPAPRSPW